MRSTTVLFSLAAVVLTSAGCGNAKSAATTAPPPTTATTATTATEPAQQPVTSATYRVTLAGFKGGAPNGSGLAVISINASSSELCWRFSRLKNVTAPTVARLYQSFPGASGRNGYHLGGAYKSSGCVALPSDVLGLIEARAQVFYVNIHDAQFPGGAVRGPLQAGGEAAAGTG